MHILYVSASRTNKLEARREQVDHDGELCCRMYRLALRGGLAATDTASEYFSSGYSCAVARPTVPCG